LIYICSTGFGSRNIHFIKHTSWVPQSLLKRHFTVYLGKSMQCYHIYSVLYTHTYINICVSVVWSKQCKDITSWSIILHVLLRLRKSQLHYIEEMVCSVRRKCTSIHFHVIYNHYYFEPSC